MKLGGGTKQGKKKEGVKGTKSCFWKIWAEVLKLRGKITKVAYI
jgi:hypothetical protein